MSNEDVIELGSSDDETEPAPKKMKPRPNAMVHIPNKLHGVTIKPVKANTASIPKVMVGRPISVQKALSGNSMAAAISSTVKPFATTKTLIGKPNPKALAGKSITITKLPNVITNPYAIISKVNGKSKQNPNFTPASNSLRTLNKSILNSLQIKKIVPQSKTNKSTPKLLVNPIRVQSPRSLNNLPSSITVTRTSTQKRIGPASVSSTVKKKRKMVKNNMGDVLTVELDDDEVSPPTSTLQWYMRPEEVETREEVETIEKVNNKEPEPSNFIEITIEDSPIKPAQFRNTYKIGTELAITIDDSPVKSMAHKNAQYSGSDNDKTKRSNDKEPHSKKKLEYPNQATVALNTVEIEIEPMEVSCAKNKTAKNNHIDNNFVEILESPAKNVEDFQTSTPKKDKLTKPCFKDTEKKIEIKKEEVIGKKVEIGKNEEIVKKEDIRKKEETEKIEEIQKENDIISEEFHPIYQSFIDLCFKLEDSEDMKKIVEKKIKAYYTQVPKTYTESEEFIDMVSSKVSSMKAGPEKMYLYIKDIVDELNMQRKMAKAQILSKATSSAESDKFLYGEDSEYDSKRQRQIRKLEKTLKKLHRAIQKLEEQEVDFDDEEDSVYLLTESEDGSSSNKDIDHPVEKKSKLLKRYKERMVRVHAKFCQLTNTKMPSEPRVQIDARPGQPTGPAKLLEKWINKKVPIGAPLPFPDFHDVIRCVKEANEEDKLGWNDADIMEEARDLFTRCGKKLQRRRQENEWRSAASRISVDMDPAENSEDLKKQLDANQQLAFKKETDVFNKYADRQKQLKLEGEEIGDKEADESPVESEDDEGKNEASLENKEKRKERLKRLLQERSKKVGDEKENELTEANELKETNVAAEKDVTKKADDSIVQDTEMREDIIENNDISNAPNDMIDLSDNNDKMEQSHSISDDSNRLESDIDELHLLQKLHSENETVTSTLESSDSDSPIAISDTLDSGSDSKKQTSDVISIENSSYSESENNKDDNNFRIDKIECVPVPCKEIVDGNDEIECSTAGILKKRNNSNNDEYNESIEDILLASSDDDADAKQQSNVNDACVNLKDDTLSIGETVIGAEFQNHDSDDLKSHKKDDTNSLDGSSVESLVFVPTEDVIGDINNPDESKKNESIGVVKHSDKTEMDQTGETAQDSLLPEKAKDTTLINESDQKTGENIDSVHMIESNNTPKDNSEIAGSSSQSIDGVTGSIIASEGITESSL